MKTIKSFYKYIDFFAVPLSFRYKGSMYYSTSLGGLCFILLAIMVLAIGIYYFIPFVNRKNFTIYYYTMNLKETEQIKLSESRANFAFGLNCEKKVNNLSVTDVLQLETKFIIFSKQSDGKFDKKKITLSTHNCGNADFFNSYNNSVNYLSLDQYQCLDDTNRVIEGIYSDQVFSYYEFSATALDGTKENFINIDTFLLNNDCKLQFYYTDITFDLDNYEEPIKDYLNSLFIQIDPTLFVKKNIYFMNQYLYNDNFLIWNFAEDAVPDQRILFSRYEEYALYQGMERYKLKPPDYLNYARIYIRADTRKTDVKRKYQKLMEFYANISAIMISAYRILIIFFNFANTFYAVHSVAKKIFFFKEIEKKNFNVFKKINEIHDLIDLTDVYIGGNIQKISFEEEAKNQSLYKKIENKNKIEDAKIINTNNNNNNNNIYKNNKQRQYLTKKNSPPPRNTHNKNRKDYETKEQYGKESDSTIKSRTINNRMDSNRKINQIIKKRNKVIDRNMDINMNIRIHSRNKEHIYELKSKNSYKEKENEKDSYYSSEMTSTEEWTRENIRNRKINYKFNICEVICSTLFHCGLPIDLKRKQNINEKANNIIFQKLDYVLYVRNMILFDLLNDYMLSEDKKNIINFISRPVISVNKDEKIKTLPFYKKYKASDFLKLSESISNTVQSSKGELKENKLINFSNRQLKKLV